MHTQWLVLQSQRSKPLSNLPPPVAPPGSQTKPFWKRRWFLVLAGILVAGGVIGALSPQDGTTTEGSTTSESNATEEVVETSAPTSTEAVVESTVTTATAAPGTTTTQVTVAPVSAAPSTQAPAASLMPLVPCGTDLQLAQDMVQGAGVFLSLSEDATGQGRMQIVDRNWVVLYSTPEPGTPIGEGDAVFYVVKDEEFQGC